MKKLKFKRPNSQNKKIKPKLRKSKQKTQNTNKKIKTRVKPKYTRGDRNAQIICIGLILVSTIVLLIMGIM